jgi:hypothetical protein
VQIFVFVLTAEMFGIWGLEIYRWKGLENTFPTVYNTPTKFLQLHLKNKKQKYVVV